MEIDVIVWYKMKYLPTKRHKKPRTMSKCRKETVEIRELNKKDFPVAFIVKDYKSVYEGSKSYFEFKGNGYFGIFPEEIRTDGKYLYSPVRVTHGAAISTEFEDFEWLHWRLQQNEPYIAPPREPYNDKSIVLHSTFEEMKDLLHHEAAKHVVFDGKIWARCGEPRYVVMTFGLGHNHGGTALMITSVYNPNISAKCYFNALQKREALEAAKAIALRRGDTDSATKFDLETFKEDIEVLMPEMVKVTPCKEADPGDSFMNRLEEITETSESVLEAGLLSILVTKTTK